jgi:hypothetical protein
MLSAEMIPVASIPLRSIPMTKSTFGFVAGIVVGIAAIILWEMIKEDGGRWWSWKPPCWSGTQPRWRSF